MKRRGLSKLVLSFRLVTYVTISISAANCTLNDEMFTELYAVNLKDISILSDSSELNFMVISDWGFNGSDKQKSVAVQMASLASRVNPEFILTSGDNFQLDGVPSCNDILWETNYENVYNDNSLAIPWFPALGNHDYRGNPDAQVDYSNVNDMWKMPSRYYTFTYDAGESSTVRFIILDSPGMINDLYYHEGNLSKIQQYLWLESTLSNSNEDWKIVIAHHPVLSAGGLHGDTEEMNMMVQPLLNKYNVDFFISGHDHHFEHAREFAEGTDYIVTGTGGDVRPAGNNFKTIMSISQLGFTYISISDTRAKLYFINNHGETGYYYERIKAYELATRICMN